MRKHLGEPIYSRFDAVIMFQNLSHESILRIVSTEFQSQYESLTSREKELVDEKDLKAKLLSSAERMTNARQIRRIVQEAISTVLVREVLRGS